MIDPRAPKTGPLEAKVLGEFHYEIREEGIQEEEDYEDPFEDSVDENKGGLVGSLMEHGCEFVGSHGWCRVFLLCTVKI